MDKNLDEKSHNSHTSYSGSENLYEKSHKAAYEIRRTRDPVWKNVHIRAWASTSPDPERKIV